MSTSTAQVCSVPPPADAAHTQSIDAGITAVDSAARNLKSQSHPNSSPKSKARPPVPSFTPIAPTTSREMTIADMRAALQNAQSPALRMIREREERPSSMAFSDFLPPTRPGSTVIARQSGESYHTAHTMDTSTNQPYYVSSFTHTHTNPLHYTLARSQNLPDPNANPPSPTTTTHSKPKTVRRAKSGGFSLLLCTNTSSHFPDDAGADAFYPYPKGANLSGAVMEVAVEVVQEEWKSDARHGGGSFRRKSRFSKMAISTGRKRNGSEASRVGMAV